MNVDEIITTEIFTDDHRFAQRNTSRIRRPDLTEAGEKREEAGVASHHLHPTSSCSFLVGDAIRPFLDLVGLDQQTIEAYIVVANAARQARTQEPLRTLDDVTNDLGLDRDESGDFVYTELHGLRVRSKAHVITPLSSDEVLELQMSLRPADDMSNREMFESVAVVAAIARFERRHAANMQGIAAILTDKCTSDDALKRYLYSVLEIDDEGSDGGKSVVNGGDEQITAEMLYMLSNGVWHVILGYVTELASPMVSKFHQVMVVVAVRADTEEEDVLEMPGLADAVAIARGANVSAQYSAPDFVANFELLSSTSIDLCLWDADSEDETVPDTMRTIGALKGSDGKDLAVGVMLATYLVARKQAEKFTGGERSKGYFATQRVHLLTNGLLRDSSEVRMQRAGTVVTEYAELSDIAAFLSYCAAPEVVAALDAATMVSKLKSGHLATASNLVNTTQKIMSALNLDVGVDRNTISDMLNFGGYRGGHPGSSRLRYAMYLHLGARGECSPVISKRLAADGPGRSAFHNLHRLIGPLHDAGFFKITNSMESYKEYIVAYRVFKMHGLRSTTYASYFFGPDYYAALPASIVETLMKFAPLAAAAATAMPNNTVNRSSALQSMAQQTANGDIVLAISCTAFLKSIKSATRDEITTKLRKKRLAIHDLEEVE